MTTPLVPSISDDDLAQTEAARPPDGWATIHCGRVAELSLTKPRAPGDAGWQYYAQRGFSAPQPVYLGFTSLSPGVVAGLLERQRQISVEGWTAEHDDLYTSGQLLKAAAVYLLKAAGLATLRVLPYWPFRREWLKADDHKRNIEKAFALIVAEMERRERSESRSKTTPEA